MGKVFEIINDEPAVTLPILLVKKKRNYVR